MDRIAAITGDHPKSPFAWRHASKFRRAGDLPSADKMRSLLLFARDRNLPLTAEDLIFGADAAELEARLAAAARAAA